MIDVSRDNLLHINEVCKRLNKTRKTVKSWMDSGELESVRLGDSLYTTPEALNAYATRDKIDPPASGSSMSFAAPRRSAAAVSRSRQEQHAANLARYKAVRNAT